MNNKYSPHIDKNLVLNNKQNSAVKMAIKDKRGLGLVLGSGGTGKSTIIHSINDHAKCGGEIVNAGTSWKAVDVMQQKMPEHYKTATIQSVLNMKPTSNRATKRSQNIDGFILDTSDNNIDAIADKDIGLLLVDECSMLPRAMQDFIIKLVDRKALRRVIFIGDMKQLPPVKSQPFNVELIDKSVTLVENRRAEGTMSLVARELELQYNSGAKLVIPDEDCVTHVNGFDDTTLLQFLKYKGTKRILTYTNLEVDKLADRLLYLDDDRELLEVGQDISLRGSYQTTLKEEYKRNYTREELDRLDKNKIIPRKTLRIKKIFITYEEIKKHVSRSTYEYWMPARPVAAMYDVDTRKYVNFPQYEHVINIINARIRWLLVEGSVKGRDVIVPVYNGSEEEYLKLHTDTINSITRGLIQRLKSKKVRKSAMVILEQMDNKSNNAYKTNMHKNRLYDIFYTHLGNDAKLEVKLVAKLALMATMMVPKHPLVSTVHGAQGDGVDLAFLDWKSFKTPNAQYVAGTRAIKEIWMVK